MKTFYTLCLFFAILNFSIFCQEQGTNWTEKYLGGSKSVEEKMFREFSITMNEIQQVVKEKQKAQKPFRGQHAKKHLNTNKVEFEVASDIPKKFQLGIFTPGKSYPVIVRFSNGDSFVRGDSSPDVRGMAFKILLPGGTTHDFLMINAPETFVIDAKEFMVFSESMAKHGRLKGPVVIAKKLGLKRKIAIFKALLGVTLKPVKSLATQQYWSQTPIKFGPYAVKYAVVPKVGTQVIRLGKDLRKELKERLEKGSVSFELQIQLYKDEATTSLEDGTAQWKTSFITIGKLTLYQQLFDTTNSNEMETKIEKMLFTPWNISSEDFRPLGNLNRSRKAVYKASAELRK